MLAGSTAIERPAVKGTPCAPRGPRSSMVTASSWKKITRGLRHSISLTRVGLRAAQALMPGQVVSFVKPCSISQVPALW